MKDKKFDPVNHSKTYREWFGHTVSKAPGGYYSPGMGTYDPKPPVSSQNGNIRSKFEPK